MDISCSLTWNMLSIIGIIASVWLAVHLMSSADPDVRGKRVLLCGGSEGIGREMALQYATMGAGSITVVARSKSKLEAVVADIQSISNGTVHAQFISMDLSSDVNCEEVVRKATELMGGIDILVLNHIRPYFDSFEATDSATVTNLVEVNLLSYIYLTKHSLPHLLETNGNIIAMSSVAGKMGCPNVAVYSATKHALHGFFDSLRMELDMKYDNNITITTCVIGNIDTESARRVTSGHLKNMPRAPPDECAKTVVNGAATGARTIYYPTIHTWPGIFLHNFFPAGIEFFIKQTVGPPSRVA